LQGGETVTNKAFKFLSALMLIVTLSLALVACGDPTATTAPTTTAAAQAKPTTAPATTTAAVATTTTAAATTAPATTAAAAALPKVSGSLTIWSAYSGGGTSEGKALAKALDMLKADNPDAKIESLDVPFDQIFNKFKTESATGGGPDLFIVPNDSLGDLVRAGLLMDVTKMLDGKLTDDLKVAVDGCTVEGKLYCIPESLKAVAMFYNKDKVKTAPTTTDEMLAAAKSGVKFGFNNNAYHPYGFFGGFGGKLFDATNKTIADQGGFADALAWMVQMKAAGATFYSDGAKFDEDFKSGKLDAVVEGPWQTADFQKALGDKLGLAMMPAGPKGPSTPLTGTDGWYVNTNTKNAQQAVNFALYMTSPKIETIFTNEAGHIPANKTIEIKDPYTQIFAKAVANGFPRPQNAELSPYWDNFANVMTQVLDKGADPKQAVADATAAMNKANKK